THELPTITHFHYTTLFRSCERVGDAELAKIVANAHLSAEAVTPVRDQHFARRIRKGLHKDWYSQVRQSQRLGRSLLVAKIGQAEDRKSTRLNSSHVNNSYA